MTVKAVDVLRLRDRDALRACVRELRRIVDIPVVFGGLLVDGEPVLLEIDGGRTGGLGGLRIRASHGLGGRAFIEGRPSSVVDYGSSQTITHEYDGVVLGEGITSLLAIPVTVFGKSRGLIYLGRRDRSVLAEAGLDQAAPIVAAFASEIRLRDEVDRRVSAIQPAGRSATPRELAGLREVHAELRLIAAEIGDQDLAERIRDVGESLLLSVSPDEVPPGQRLDLAPREVDVLSLVALGCGNAEIATRLCIRPETVRSYLRNAMRKLDVHTRIEAVVVAQKRGVLI